MLELQKWVGWFYDELFSYIGGMQWCLRVTIAVMVAWKREQERYKIQTEDIKLKDLMLLSSKSKFDYFCLYLKSKKSRKI